MSIYYTKEHFRGEENGQPCYHHEKSLQNGAYSWGLNTLVLRMILDSRLKSDHQFYTGQSDKLAPGLQDGLRVHLRR